MQKYRIALVTLIVLVACSSVFGQAGMGTFNGSVADPSGAVIPGVTVTATNTATGAARSTTTNGAGLYSLPALVPGIYNVKAEAKANFAPSVQQGVNLNADSTLTLNFKLSVAGTSQNVTVTEVAPLIETTVSTASSNLENNEVVQLPMVNRTLSTLIALSPGVRAETTNMNVAGTSTVHTYYNVGGNGRNSMELVDGVDNHDDNDSGSSMQITLEAVQEMNVMAHGAPAEYGRSGGGVVDISTKTGGNQFHGSAFGYGRSDAMTKIDYFSDPSRGGPGKPPYTREQFGGSVGGPIKKDRLYFFGATEDILQNYTLTEPQSVVALEQDLVAGTAPLNVYVKPSAAIPQPYHDWMSDARFDAVLSRNNTAFFRFDSELAKLWNSTLGASNTVSPQAAAPLKWSDINTFPETDYQFSDTWLASSKSVNEFEFQWLHYRKNDVGMNCTTPNQGGQGPALGLTVDQCTILNMTFPSIVTKEFETGGFPDYDEEHAEFRDVIAQQEGKHDFKYGADLITVPFANGSQDLSGGSVTFFNDANTILNNTNGEYPQGFFTPGIVETLSLASQTTPNFRTYGMWYFSSFGQDSYTVSPKLTLNLGVRYDFFHNLNQDRLPYNRFYQVFEQLGSPFAVIPTASKLDFSPRVGLAWNVAGNGRDVVRADFGMYYPVQCVTSYFESNYYENPTLPITQTYSDSAVGKGTLANYVYGGAFPVTRVPAGSTQLAPGAAASGGDNTGTVWYYPGLRDQYEMISHIGLAHALRQNTVVSVDVTHIQGVHEWRPLEVNPLCTANSYGGPCETPGPVGANAGPAAIGTRDMAPALAALGEPGLLGAVTLTASVFRSQYNEMVVAFTRRSGRITFQANYTLSYADGYGGNVGGLFVSNAGGYQPEIPGPWGGCITCKGEWGPGAADERNRVVMYGVIDLPFGFEVSPILTAASALPYQIYRSTSPAGYGDLRCYVGTSSQTPVNACITGNGTGQEVGVNAERGDPLLDFDARTSKVFKLPREESVTGFVEFYNITDRPNFGANYGGNAFAASTYLQPLGYIGGVPGSSATTVPSFQIQLGARYSF